MSKGFGKWEREILSSAERDGYVYPGAVAEFMFPGSLAALQCAMRATTSLERKGLVRAAKYHGFSMDPKKDARYKVIAWPVNTDPPVGRPPVGLRTPLST
jgi:hypothetical protein